VGTARSHKSDVGTMHPIGTRVLLDGATMTEFAANSKVPARMFQTFVHSLARIGGSAFPGVLAVIQDAALDACALPCTAMAADGGGYRVGYSVDMSVHLANASARFQCVDQRNAGTGLQLAHCNAQSPWCFRRREKIQWCCQCIL
jgi:hypothetical protein